MRLFWKMDKTLQNHVFCGHGFLAMCYMPGLDNIVLIDFCSAMLHYFARILGCMVPMPSVLAILWDTHRFLGSIWFIRKLRSSFSLQKHYFSKFYFQLMKNLFLYPGARPTSLLPSGRNEGWPHGLKSGRYSFFGPWWSQDLCGVKS